MSYMTGNPKSIHHERPHTTLYKGKKPVKTIPEERAIDELIALLRDNDEL